DEANAEHLRSLPQLVFEILDSQHRRLVGDADADHADPLLVAVEHLAERMSEKKAGTGQDHDQRDRENAGRGDRYVPPEALPGAAKREEQMPPSSHGMS